MSSTVLGTPTPLVPRLKGLLLALGVTSVVAATAAAVPASVSVQRHPSPQVVPALHGTALPAVPQPAASAVTSGPATLPPAIAPGSMPMSVSPTPIVPTSTPSTPVTNDDRAAAGSVEGTHPSYTELLNLHTRARLIHSHEEMTVTTTGTALEIPVEVDAPSASEDTPQGQTPPAATPIPPLPTSAPASPSEVGQGRWIDVDLTRQMVTAYEGATPVRAVAVSTGLPSTPTPVGQFRIWVKFRYDDMEGPGYYLRDVPYTMYFHDGYGLHGTYWHNNFGHPMSHGCVNLPTPEAEWLFHWAEVGTLVNVHH